jgi:phage shock protein PspC (stress-responsive transcriptional regulator)
MVAGVCEGLARYFDVNPALYRVGFVVLTLLGGAGILIYLAAVLVIPEEGREDSIAAEALRTRQDRPWALVGLGLVAVAGAVLLSRASLWPQGDAAWVLALVAGGVILFAQRSRGSGSARAVAATADGEPVEPVRASHVMRNLSIVLAAIVVAILVAAAAVASVLHVNVGDGVGDRTYVAAGATDVHRDYRLGVGSLRIDLSGAALPVGETPVSARVGIGELRVIVPADVALRVEATSRAGEVHVLGRSDDGRNAAVRVSDPGLRMLVLDARVGLGKVDVVRAPLTP